MNLASKFLLTIGALFSLINASNAQFPGCPNIDAGPDQTLPCTTPCTNLTATPFATGTTTTYTVGAIPHTPPIAYNAAGGNAISVNTDDVWSGVINLPFNFCFYGVNYTSVKVGSNGAIQFGPAAGGGGHPWSFTASCPSTALTSAGNVFGVYHDIDPSVAGSVKWYLTGTAPCRILVVSFNNLGHFSCTSLRSTHMMVLYETTNVIDVYVSNKATCTSWNGGRAIIGIQNPAGTAGIAAPGRNAGTTWTVTTPEGWRFTPNGTPNYSVAWFQGATQIGTGNNINVCPTGTTTYTARVTYNRCDGTTVVENDDVVVNFSNLAPATVTPTAETCANYNNGSVVINNPVGAGPYTVSIAGPTTGSVVEANTATATANFTNLPDGNYTYTVTGANGCTTNGTFTINPGGVCCSVTATSTNILCNGTNSGTATATPTGQAPYSYSWTGGQTTQTASNLGAGTFTVTMTDNTGCVATANTTITQPTALTGSLAAVNVLCNGSCTGSITVTASGGTAPYQYSSNGGAFQAGNSFTNLCNGTYAITIRDANNCTITLNQTITQPAVLNLVQGTLTPTSCGLTNGTATVTASGGLTPYSYQINGGTFQASNSFTGLPAGTHTVVVRDANNCTKNLSITITSTNAPVASILNQTNVSCFGGLNGSVIIGLAGGSSPFVYTLNGVTQPSNTFTNLGAGTYTATVTDANSCVATVAVIITSPPQLTFTNTPTAVSCNGSCDGQIAVNASGGTAPYQYSSNGGVTFGLGTSLTGLCAGLVSVVVKDANGCLTNADVTITQPAVVSATFVKTNPICHTSCDGEFVVNATGGTPAYQYSLNGGTFQSSNTLTGACGGNSTIVVRDANNCTFTSVQNLVSPPGFDIDTNFVTPSSCGFNSGAISVFATGLNGPYEFSFEGDPFSTNNLFTDLYAGGYLITAVDQLGCTESEYFGVNDVEMSGITISQTDALCYGAADGTIEVQGLQGANNSYNYDLDNQGVTQATGNFLTVGFGSHVITIYDAGNCVFTIPFTVFEPTEIEFFTDVTDVSCNGGSSGEIEFINVTGGTGTHQYSIDGGITFQPAATFTGLAATSFDLAVMDANGCMVFGNVTIDEAPELQFQTTVIDLTCFNNATGGIQIGATGGTAPYQYSIDNGATFTPIESFFNLAAGTYNLVVEDAAGCQTLGNVTVNEPTQVTATYNPIAALCNDVCDGQIVVTASGGTAPYLYSPDNGLNFFVSNTLVDLCAGNIDLRVKDNNGCFISAVQVVTEPTAVTLTTALTDETCSASNGEIVVTGAGGTGAYEYSIDNGTTYSTNNTFPGLAANTYTVFVKDANDCEQSTPVAIVNESSPIIIGASVQNVSCNGACDGELQVTVSGGTGAISYSIGTAQPASLITGICAGNYTLTITDQNGCTDTDPVVVTEPAVLTAVVTPTNLTCNNNFTGEIEMIAAGGTTPYQYSIDNGVSFSSQSTVEFLAAGTYNTVVRDANNCTVNNTVTITEPAVLEITNIAVTNASCFGFCDGDATATVSGGTAPYTYTWSNGTSTPTTTNALCAGTYDLTVEDANGCSAYDVFIVSEPPALSITNVDPISTLCNGSCDGSAIVMAPQATNYSIDNGVTFQPSNVITGLCAGSYTVIVQDVNGCTQTESFSISEPQPLVQGVIPEDGITICYDGFGTLSASATGGTAPYYYVWNTGDTTQYLNVNLTAPATFICTVYDQNGCVAANVESADVNIRPIFEASLTTPINVCPGNSVTFTASGINGLPGIGYGYNYEWYSNDNMDLIGLGEDYTFTPTVSDTIIMVAHDECFTYDTIPAIVNIYTVPFATFVPDPAAGCSPLSVNFTMIDSTGIATTAWDFGDGTTQTGGSSMSHVFTDVGCYDVAVTLTTVDGCVKDTTINNVVCVNPDPIADFKWDPVPPTTTNSVVKFINQSVNAVSSSWDFGYYGTSSNQNPVVNYGLVEPGTYEACLLVTSQDGCTNEVCKSVVIIEEFLIYVPNTFTPDGDEFNNTFKPIVPPGLVLDDYKLTVYNRWGEIMFESLDVDFGWDGTYQNVQVKEGTYTWVIEAKGGYDKKARRLEGHVNMLR